MVTIAKRHDCEPIYCHGKPTTARRARKYERRTFFDGATTRWRYVWVCARCGANVRVVT